MKSDNQKYKIKSLASNVGDFTVSLHYDRRLYKQDIAGSKAHVSMLAYKNIIEKEDAETILKALDDILYEIESDQFPWNSSLEDIHMNIESRLFDKVGAVAGKLHTGRSRNDQVVLDMRMYLMEASKLTVSELKKFCLVLLDLAEKNIDQIIPGYTHMQRAQPVLFSHHMMAYFEMFYRDIKRFKSVYESSDVMPLGSGALAGVTYPIDREYVADMLGFSKISSNSMDSVSDRDFIIEYISSASISIMHISRLSEEIILWNSEEFSMIKLPIEYTTGSSMMPQKRNPDFAELSRGKSGRIYGSLISILTIMKSLPLTYNRDMQEDKEGFFDTYDTLIAVLSVFGDMLKGLKIDSLNMETPIEKGMLLATDIADYLVKKGLTFRDSYSIVSELSDFVASSNKELADITLLEFKEFSEFFSEDVKSITPSSSIESRNIPGGTSTEMVSKAIANARKKLSELDANEL
ncbi:MAG: argininosuccinate lyase [SAR202 cluster bacterium]|nr:argininosuccinate lyase [Chloroflexota bacterium]MQG21932.1 argininosuccinate lyase [SAR202 cluster bacterium]|tara:strand:- start:26909 stop:28300 length:1392 start_codon:yes stop_codon:yes gene_type:complete